MARSSGGWTAVGKLTWADPAPGPDPKIRRVRIAVLVRREEGEERPIPLRIPLLVKSLDRPLERRAVAVGVLQGPTSHAVADLELPLGRHLVTSQTAPPLRAGILLRRAPEPASGICSHSAAHPTEIRNLVQPGEEGGGPWVGVQEAVIRPCCHGQFSFWREARKNLFEVGVYLPLSGTLRLHGEGREHEIPKGSYMVETPLHPLQYAEVQRWPMRYRHFFFPQRALRRIRDELDLPKSLGPWDFALEPRRVQGGIQEALELWSKVYNQPAGFGRDELMQLAGRWLLVRLLQEHPNTLGGRRRPHVSNEDSRVSAARRLLERHLAEHIPLGRIAREVGMSLRSLQRLFREERGVTLKDDLQRFRMERAMTLLRDRSMDVQAVALAVGYRDLRTFCRVFKEHTQASSRSFRP